MQDCWKHKNDVLNFTEYDHFACFHLVLCWLKKVVLVQVRLISEFVSYGTTSLLEDTLLEIIQPDLPQALTALEVSWQLRVLNWERLLQGYINFGSDE